MLDSCRSVNEKGPTASFRTTETGCRFDEDEAWLTRCDGHRNEETATGFKSGHRKSPTYHSGLTLT